MAVSKVQCVMFGVQALPLSAAEPTLLPSSTRSLSRIRVLAARAMAELLNSMTASTPSAIHCRAMARPMLGSLRWSAEIRSTVKGASAGSSRIACPAHSSDRRPPRWL